MGDDRDDTRLVAPRSRLGPDDAPASGPDTGDTVILTGAVLSVSAGLPASADRADPAVGDPATPGEGAPLAASAYYSYRIGDYLEAIPLDLPSYIGRRPSAPRVSQGVAPRLVRVASPLREVSATHLEIRQLGSSVIVTDLRTTNGSTVMLPGSVPRKLRQGESVVVSPGTLVDIGDENVLQILPMQRLG